MKFILRLFLILFVNYCFSQNYVMDINKKTPIEFVNVIYGNKGLITNNDGYFEISNYQPDSIKFSHISYNTLKLANINIGDTIFLEESRLILNQVVLKIFSASDTIKKAINKIKANYLNIPHNYKGFYRSILQEDNKGVEMVEVEFVGFIKGLENQYTAKIINAQKTKNFSEIDFSITGGAKSLINGGNIIMQRQNFLKVKENQNFIFEYVGIVNNTDNEVYKISFKPKEGLDLKYLREGVIYLDTESLAFIEISYNFLESKLNIIKQMAKDVKKKKNKPFFVINYVENTIKYRKMENEKYILSSINLRNDRFGTFKNKKRLYSLTSNLVINKVITENVLVIKTNYNDKKDFSNSIEKFQNLKNWTNNYRYPLSTSNKKSLKEIQGKELIKE